MASLLPEKVPPHGSDGAEAAAREAALRSVRRRSQSGSPDRERRRSRSPRRSAFGGDGPGRRRSRSPDRRDRHHERRQSPRDRRSRSPDRRDRNHERGRSRSRSRSGNRGHSPRADGGTGLRASPDPPQQRAHEEAVDAIEEYKRKLNLSGSEAFARRAALSGGRPPAQIYGRYAAGGGVGEGGGGGGPPDRREGDWTCPKCNANVFASKAECFRCQEPRPEGLGRPQWSGGGAGGGPGRDRGPVVMPAVNSIVKGKVVRVADFGAFVEMPGFSKWGLVHVSQLVDSSGKGQMKIEVKDVVDLGDSVWVKVCEVDSDAGKMSLSMKYVSQATGRDLDPEQAEYEYDKQRRGQRGEGRGRDAKIDIDDPMTAKGQFREDAWKLLQKRGRQGKVLTAGGDAGDGEYDMMRSPSPSSEVAGRSGGHENPNLIPLEPRNAAQRQKDEMKMLKALLKREKKDKKRDKSKKKKDKSKKSKEKAKKKAKSSSSSSEPD